MLRQIAVFEQVPLAVINKKIIKAERMPKPKQSSKQTSRRSSHRRAGTHPGED